VNERVYLDYNATAPVRPEVRDAMLPILFGDPEEGSFGNASSIHWAGQLARKHLEAARAKVAAILHRKPSEIGFTSGGTEADNLAILGPLLHPKIDRPRLIVSAVEHPAVLAAVDRAERCGAAVARIGVDRSGRLDLDALERALDAPATLVSVMAVNNETGVVHPIASVLALARARGVPVHVDAVQAAGRIPLPLDADIVTLSGHKLGAPKGIGVIARRESIPFEARLVGGPQERGLRAGTEPVASCVGFAEALSIATAEEAREAARLRPMIARIEALLDSLGGVEIVGRPSPRSPNTTTAVFSGVEGDALLQALDLDGVAASSGSACSSGSLEPSHVLAAMGFTEAEALGAVRFSLGWASKEADIGRLEAVLPAVLRRARA
jgi:cysteine desulfurase